MPVEVATAYAFPASPYGSYLPAKSSTALEALKCRVKWGLLWTPGSIYDPKTIPMSTLDSTLVHL